MIEAGTSRFWRAALAMSIGSFLIFANLYMTQPLLPLFVEAFGVSETVSSLSVSLVILSLSLFLLVFAALSDAYGRKPIMVFSMVGVTVSTWLLIWVPNFSLLLVLRALQGVFLAGLPAVALAYLADEVEPRALSAAVGIYISGNTIGGMVGRVIAGFAADRGGYELTFLVMGCISLLCLALFMVLLPEAKLFQPRPLRWRESVGAMRQHLVNPVLLPAFFVGGLHFFLFVGLYNDVTFLLSSPPYHLSPGVLGLLFFTYAAGTVSSTLAGWANRWWRSSTGIAFGIACMAGGLLITLARSLGAIICGLLAFCFGYFFAHSLTSSYVSKQASFAKASASSLFLIAYYLGGSVGSTVLGMIYFAWQWEGVIAASMLVLLATFGLSQVKRRHEARQHAAGESR
ncbi:MFS transporter [Brevibacillus marinus]|uniref:MFS transporter n=1 Tax=Brevibacillus marinus TaxID=2496837 RepID=UPI0013DFD091|nr:MFS transporter [Brevibacillus marinus]